MRAEILAVGTELLMGQIANTNAQYLSAQLASLGIDLFYHSVVGDNMERIISALNVAAQRSEILLITGGLGPTDDDITKEATARFLGKKLIEDSKSRERIEAYFRTRKMRMTENNIRQAQVIEGGSPFPNDWGLAAGMGIASGGRHYLLFPGPPAEMIPMFQTYGIPYLRKITPSRSSLYSKILRFAGIGESALVTEIADLIAGQSDPTIAPYAKATEVTLRVTTRAADEAEAEKKVEPTIRKILDRVGSYYYGEGEGNTIELVLFQRLKREGLTLSSAESCTGGLIGQLLTSVPGSSSVYKGGITAYSNLAKEKLLGIPAEMLKAEGAVSEKTAAEMARRIRLLLGTDYGLSVTGVAGPAPQEEKPVGLVYLGFADAQSAEAMEVRFAGTREHIRLRAAKSAIFKLWKRIKER